MKETMKEFESIKIFSEGEGDLFQPPDLDNFRAYIREHKPKGLVSKVMTEQEAISKLVNDNEYIVYDCNMFQRGPNLLIREIIRQRRKNLGVAGKFTYADIDLLVAGGCIDKIDAGFIGVGLSPTTRAIKNKKVKLTEWSNSALSLRLLAGGMGIPFIPARFLGGTDTYKKSGAKLSESPFSGERVTLLPALNPDVALIHVHQCDIYGNARIFGCDISSREAAFASKKVIISTEEIIDTEHIRKNPSQTTIPFYLVDAIVEAPFGAYPGEMPGLYVADMERIYEILQVLRGQDEILVQQYLDKNVYEINSHEEFLEKRVGLTRLIDLKRRVENKEGYY